MIAALVPGTAALVASGGVVLREGVPLALAAPLLYAPQFSWQALLELVVPLAITVIAIQNAQGQAVLRAAGYTPPINVLTVLCGVGTCLFGLLGSVPTCVTGPANAILTSSGARGQHYAGGVVFGACMLLFGLFAPAATRLALALPAAFIALIGGLALLPVLGNAFHVAFGTQFQLGALVAFLLTVSEIEILRIGAPFWGLVGGFVASWLLEREALRKLWEAT
ncbi:MAG: hypothetical protein KatS3mg131_3221 [Candidatus Tectimicrobiota bacterium]|nr:MAG: hypothetical protein KatS3mg131_3221 [Candidatus Tectomicrobia bacterium]